MIASENSNDVGKISRNCNKPCLDEIQSSNNTNEINTPKAIYNTVYEEQEEYSGKNELQNENNSQNTNQLMPHDKNAINFLINEYLLEQHYKLTQITFAEENESLDLECWDNVGLNRSKPPNLRLLYKYYLNKNNVKIKQLSTESSESAKTDILSKKQFNEISIQANVETESISTNTNEIKTKDFDQNVNLDHDAFDQQKTQINKLLEKQQVLLKSISKLEHEILTLNAEKESHLKKIDLM